MTPPTGPRPPLDIQPPPAGSRMPETLRPMLSTEAREPFDSPDYLFELMWGGLRCLAHVRDGVVRLRGRNGHDLTAAFPELAAMPERLHAR